MIELDEIRELVRRYKEPVTLIFGSHSALDARGGARNYGLRSIIYTTYARAPIYLQNIIAGEDTEYIENLPEISRRDVKVVFDPRDINKKETWKLSILILDEYRDIYKYIDDLLDLEAIQIPNRAFSVYLCGDSYCKDIEEKFKIPIFGSRKLLKIENRGKLDRDYYWYIEKAGVPYPKKYEFEVYNEGIRFKEYIDEPMILKAEHPARKFERAFIFASDSHDLEEKVEKEIRKGALDKEVLEKARVEQLVLGPHANFNFFYSPLNAVEEWGDVDDILSKIYQVSLEESRIFLANELMSIDERRESILDGLKRLPVDVQKKIEEKTNPSFEVTFHSIISIRESLIKDILKIANSLLLTLRKYAYPGIIGAWCLQTLITWDKTSRYNYTPSIKIDFTLGSTSKSPKDYGLYDVTGETELYMHIPVTQDLALRHGGGTNVHMGIGGQYSNIKYNRVISMGDRIALEITRASKKNMLHLLVT